MHNFKELRIWQDSVDIVEDIYKVLKDFPKNEQYGLVSQMNRCSVSIPSNIAEESGRGSNKDFIRFLNISLFSAFELETQLIISKRIEFINTESFNSINTKLTKVQKMIFVFIEKLNNTLKIR